MGRHGRSKRSDVYGGSRERWRSVIAGLATAVVLGSAFTAAVLHEAGGSHHVSAAPVGRGSAGTGAGSAAPLPDVPSPPSGGAAPSEGPTPSASAAPGGGNRAKPPAKGSGRAAGGATPAVSKPGGAGARRAVLPASASEAEAGALRLINIERAEAGCRPLTVSPALVALAVDHSRDMAAAGYADTTSPTWGTVWKRAERSGIEGVAAENIARGPADPQALLNVWTGRPGARKNLLDCNYRSTGIGAYFNGSGFWWTEEFAA